MSIPNYELERSRIASLDISDRADINNPVFGEGNGDRPVLMFIGEAPGREEAACGKPFVGKAGKQLDEMLLLAGIDRSKVFVTNTVKNRPIKINGNHVSNRTPTEKEIDEGLPLLEEEIASVSPKVIATLGNVPLSALLKLAGVDQKPSIGIMHGCPLRCIINGLSITLYPLYHPAASIYNRALKPVLEEDLSRLGDYCRSL